MNFPIVKEYRTDLKWTNPENDIKKEPILIPLGEKGRIIVPRHAPFFVESLALYAANGAPLILDKDYRVFRLMPRLTELTAQEVSCMIEIMDDNITDVLVDYHTVGNFSLLDQSFIQLVESAVKDDRIILWENLLNKPVVFPPELHTHSLIYEVTSFQDMVDFLDKFLTNTEKNLIEVRLEYYSNLLTKYIVSYTATINTFLDNHKSSYNAHGLTKAQVGLSKVDNFATATPAQAVKARSDLHLTPGGMDAILSKYSFDKALFLEAKRLPISQYGFQGASLVTTQTTGWTIKIPNPAPAVFQGKAYTIPAWQEDLSQTFLDPSNRTFYLYAVLSANGPTYEIVLEKRLESPYSLWVGLVTTLSGGIGTVQMFNVFAMDGHRVSETKRGNCIPASSGAPNTLGSCPWLRTREILP